MSFGKCTEYVWVDDLSEEDRRNPCQCPVCKGFLKWTEERQPICNKCHTPLVAIAETDEYGSEWGRVCVLKPIQFISKQGENEFSERCKRIAALSNNPIQEQKGATE